MRRILTLLLFSVLFLISVAQARIDFYSDGVIQDGVSYDNVFVWNDAVVDMTGGVIQSLDTFNISVVNLEAGTIAEGASIWNDSTLHVFDGGIEWFLQVADSGVVNLHGGQINDWLYATDSSVVNIYGYGFNYDPDAGGSNGGQLTGFWMDDTPFSIDFLDNIEVGSTYYEHVVLIPEPATFLLLGLGAVMLRKRKR